MTSPNIIFIWSCEVILGLGSASPNITSHDQINMMLNSVLPDKCIILAHFSYGNSEITYLSRHTWQITLLTLSFPGQFRAAVTRGVHKVPPFDISGISTLRKLKFCTDVKTSIIYPIMKKNMKILM